MTANGGWNPGSASDWQNFSQVYPQYQALMANNNATANAAMNRAGGMGASSGTPYSSALGQLAMQGASGLQSLFSHGGGGGGSYGPPQPAAQPDQWANPRACCRQKLIWYGDPDGAQWISPEQYMGSSSLSLTRRTIPTRPGLITLLGSLGLSTGTANMNTGLLGQPGRGHWFSAMILLLDKIRRRFRGLLGPGRLVPPGTGISWRI